MNKINILFTIIFTFLFSVCSTVFAANASLQADISTTNNTFNDQDDINISIKITNISHQPIQILRWNLPSKNLEANLFSITRDGVKVPYQGKLIKRVSPTAQDFITLQPNENYSSHVELSSTYDMDASGNYEAELKINYLSGLEKNADVQANNHIYSNKIHFWLDNSTTDSRATPLPEPEANSLGQAGFSTQACSNSQRNQINRASNSAISMARNASSYLARGQLGSRYTTWFGSYNSSRLNTTRRNFSAISDAVSNKPVVYDCSCTLSHYAYVYSNRPYRIYLCNAFWGAPNTGTDSKSGTIIHELSHFNVVAGTSDHAYGHSLAKNLARQSPNRAVNNADNHEYFAENSPYLP